MELNLNTNIDIEILGLFYGIARTSEISKTNEDAIREMLEKLNPENHVFFCFVKDCIVYLIGKIGVEEAAKKLEISVPVLKTIVKYSKTPNKALKASQQTGPKFSKSIELKNQVIEYYNACKSLAKTVKKFNIPRDVAISFIINSPDLIE